MKVELALISPAAPLQLTMSFNGVEYFYRERHYRWSVSRKEFAIDGEHVLADVEIDAGVASNGDFITEGLARIFHAASTLEQLLFQEYDTNLEDSMKLAGY